MGFHQMKRIQPALTQSKSINIGLEKIIVECEKALRVSVESERVLTVKEEKKIMRWSRVMGLSFLCIFFFFFRV